MAIENFLLAYILVEFWISTSSQTREEREARQKAMRENVSKFLVMFIVVMAVGASSNYVFNYAHSHPHQCSGHIELEQCCWPWSERIPPTPVDSIFRKHDLIKDYLYETVTNEHLCSEGVGECRLFGAYSPDEWRAGNVNACPSGVTLAHAAVNGSCGMWPANGTEWRVDDDAYLREGESHPPPENRDVDYCEVCMPQEWHYRSVCRRDVITLNDGYVNSVTHPKSRLYFQRPAPYAFQRCALCPGNKTLDECRTENYNKLYQPFDLCTVHYANKTTAQGMFMHIPGFEHNICVPHPGVAHAPIRDWHEETCIGCAGMPIPTIDVDVNPNPEL